jgi:predicted RNase H-like nuclease (RuvC/YqgF family)
LAAVTSLAACDKSKDELQMRVAELTTLQAQKDSLIQEVMSTTQFVGDLTADLAAVKSLNAGKPVAAEASDVHGQTPAQMRATVRERVRELATRLGQSESRLAQSRARVQSLSGSNSQMQGQLAVYDSTINSLRQVLESQKTEIAALSEQVLGLQQANVLLAATRDTLTVQRDQLTSTVSTMTVESNKAYYIVGTEDELVKKGILEKRGGVLGIGKTTVPVRALKESDFTEIDRMRDSSIALPKPDKGYVIASRQDVQFLSSPLNKDGEIVGTLTVGSPEQFWSTSKFLIIVEK